MAADPGGGLPGIATRRRSERSKPTGGPCPLKPNPGPRPAGSGRTCNSPDSRPTASSATRAAAAAQLGVPLWHAVEQPQKPAQEPATLLLRDRGATAAATAAACFVSLTADTAQAVLCSHIPRSRIGVQARDPARDRVSAEARRTAQPEHELDRPRLDLHRRCVRPRHHPDAAVLRREPDALGEANPILRGIHNSLQQLRARSHPVCSHPVLDEDVARSRVQMFPTGRRHRPPAYLRVDVRSSSDSVASRAYVLTSSGGSVVTHRRRESRSVRR